MFLQIGHLRQIRQHLPLQLQAALLIPPVDTKGRLLVQQNGIERGTPDTRLRESTVKTALGKVILSFGHQARRPFVQSGQKGVGRNTRLKHRPKDEERQTENETLDSHKR